MAFIDSVALTGVPVAMPENKAVPYNYTHTENGVEHYTVTGAWSEYDSSVQEYKLMDPNDLFQDDGSYQLTLRLDTKKGYVFSEQIEVLVNDEMIQPDNLGDFECTVNLCNSFGTEITEVYFTVPEPVVGQAPSRDTLKSAEPEKYEITYAEWFDTTDGLWEIYKYRGNSMTILQKKEATV